MPGSRLDYWRPKLDRNVERDANHQLALSCIGWRSLVIWECEMGKVEVLRKRIEKFLT